MPTRQSLCRSGTSYTPIIEPLSLDEVYLDVTENLKGIVLATQIAEENSG
jgi:nucleotidyltransferase/DNA polymerase involved in DNA repair